MSGHNCLAAWINTLPAGYQAATIVTWYFFGYVLVRGLY